MKYDVFISYASEDQKIVEALSHYLEADGIRCFIAYRDIPYGVKWEAAIPEAIENSKILLAVYSGHFNLSPQTDKELSLFSKEQKPILTFRIENSEFTGVKKYLLSNLNWIDAFPNPEQKFSYVKESIKRLLDLPANQPAEPKAKVNYKLLFYALFTIMVSIGIIATVILKPWEKNNETIFLVGSGTVSSYLNHIKEIAGSPNICTFDAPSYDALRLIREVKNDGSKNFYAVAMSAIESDIKSICDSATLKILDNDNLKIVEVCLSKGEDRLQVILKPHADFKEFTSSGKITIENLNKILEQSVNDKNTNILRTSLTSGTLNTFNKYITVKLDDSNSKKFYDDDDRVDLGFNKSKPVIILCSSYYSPAESTYINDEGKKYDVIKDETNITKKLYLYFVVKNGNIPEPIKDMLDKLKRNDILEHINANYADPSGYIYKDISI